MDAWTKLIVIVVIGAIVGYLAAFWRRSRGDMLGALVRRCGRHRRHRLDRLAREAQLLEIKAGA